MGRGWKGRRFIGNHIAPDEVSQRFPLVRKHAFPEGHQHDSGYRMHCLPFTSSPRDFLSQLFPRNSSPSL